MGRFFCIWNPQHVTLLVKAKRKPVMKRARITTYGFIILMVLGVYFLLKPHIWHSFIVHRLNIKYLNAAGWEISINRFEGHLLSKIHADNIKFINTDGRTVELPDLMFNFNPISLFFGGISFDDIEINDIYIKTAKGISQDSFNEGKGKISPTRFILPLSVKNLKLHGLVSIDSPDSYVQINMDIQGEIGHNSQNIWATINDLNIQNLKDNTRIQLQNAFIQISNTTIITSITNANINGVALQGDLKYFEDKVRHLQGNLSLLDYHIPADFFGRVPLQPEISSLDIHFSFNTDFALTHGTLQVKSPLGLDMSGEFLVQDYQDYLKLHQVTLQSSDAKLFGKGVIEKTGRINGSLELENFDLSEWLISDKITRISGITLLEGNIENGQIASVSISAEIQDSGLYQGEILSLSGSASYSNESLQITDPLIIGIDQSSIEASGWANFDDRTMDFHCELQNASPFLLNNFWSDTLEQGLATGLLHINGSFEEPMVVVDVDCKNILFKNLYVSDGSLDATINNIDLLDEGYARIRINKGTYEDNLIDNASLEIQFLNDGISIDHLYVKEGENYLELNGHFDKNKILDISRIQMAYKSHFIINPSNIKISFQDSINHLFPFKLHVDDGVIEGTAFWDDAITGNVKLSNINSEIISWFAPENIPEFSGVVFGEINTQPEFKSQGYEVDVAIKNGELKGQPFQDLLLSFVFHDSILHIDEMTLIGDKTGIQLSGTIPQGFPKQNTKIPFSLETSFTHMDMEWFMTLMPPWFHIEGLATGVFSLSSTQSKTIFDYDLDIDNTIFDRIPLGHVKGVGNYDGVRMNTESFSSEKPNGDQIYGNGYIPLDFTPGSPLFAKFKPSESLLIDVQGTFRNMDFLTLYISDVDSIDGDVDLQLNLSGVPEQIMRNGSIKINDGSIYTLLLNDPIRHVEGSAIILDNKFSLETFTGSMHKKSSSKQKNLTITGGMDLTKFFKPNYNFRAKGNNLYMEVLDSDITGSVSADINITGRDTITIEGDVGLINVEMFQEFVSNTIGSTVENGNVVLEYKINFPIVDQFTLLNSQMDAKLIGEISYTKLGNYTADYAGELQFEEGKYYFSGDIFDITYGYLAFDNHGFNPYLEVEAVTTIEDEIITLQIVGTLDNLVITPSSSSGYSPSDIFELLMMGTRIEDQEFSAIGLGVQSQQMVGAWLTRQIERNLSNLGNTGKLGIIDDVSITGATSLIDPKSKEELAIKAGITDNLSFAYRRSFSLASPLNEVGVEVKVNRYISLVGNVDETGNFNVKYRLRYSY